MINLKCATDSLLKNKIKSKPIINKIDPYKITNFTRTQSDLEVFYLFAAAVAGKKATMIAEKVHRFLTECEFEGTPFERIRQMIKNGNLDANLRRVRMGKYRLLNKSYAKAAMDPLLDLNKVTPHELESFDGFGKKSSRFLIIHSRPSVQVAVIDTHLLKYLKAMKFENIPDKVPTNSDYERLENIVLEQAKIAGLEPYDFDLRIWSFYAEGKKGLPDFLKSELSEL